MKLLIIHELHQLHEKTIIKHKDPLLQDNKRSLEIDNIF